jgi:hypothetical protein
MTHRVMTSNQVIAVGSATDRIVSAPIAAISTSDTLLSPWNAFWKSHGTAYDLICKIKNGLVLRN